MLVFHGLLGANDDTSVKNARVKNTLEIILLRVLLKVQWKVVMGDASEFFSMVSSVEIMSRGACAYVSRILDYVVDVKFWLKGSAGQIQIQKKCRKTRSC